MNLPDLQSAADSAQALRDMRAAPRFALLLRAAKLVGPRGEYLCIVRDISQSGVKLRLFHSLAGETGLALESVTGEQIPLKQVWERDGEGGFRFDEPIDVVRFIAEVGPYPKRPIRIAVDHPAVLYVAGETVSARLLNLSRQGAGIEVDGHLAIGQQLRVEAEGLPEFEGTVCWRHVPHYGLVFRQIMSLEELALRTFAIRRPA